MLTYIFTGSVDYDSGPYTVTFRAGVTNVSFDVPIIDDNIFELFDETFVLTIDQSSLPTGFTVNNPNQAMVTIKDDDGEFLINSEIIVYMKSVFTNFY